MIGTITVALLLLWIFGILAGQHLGHWLHVVLTFALVSLALEAMRRNRIA